MSTKESVEKFLLMAGQADSTAKAHFTSAVMTQEARIDALEVANGALATKIGQLVNGQSHLMNKQSFLELEIKKPKPKPRKKRANKPQSPGGPLSRLGGG